jgi:2'-5' RNA ligase
VARLFAAVWPPASLVAQLRGLDRPARPGLRWSTEDQWHVTLRFFGQVDEVTEVTLRAALRQTAVAASTVEVSAGPAPRGLGRAVWALPVEGLETLAKRIADVTAKMGQPAPDRRFRGHITLARGRRPGTVAELAASPVSARWTVREITLVRSDLRPEGARYEVVGRWPLGSPPAGRVCVSGR